MPLVAVIDRARGKAVLPGRRLPLGQRAHLGENLVALSAVFRKPRVGLELALVGFGVVLHPLEHSVELLFDDATHQGDSLEALVHEARHAGIDTTEGTIDDLLDVHVAPSAGPSAERRGSNNVVFGALRGFVAASLVAIQAGVGDPIALIQIC